jgi:fatty-acyl-CoA synthase
MMDYQLTLPRILQRARKVFPHKEIVSALDGRVHRCTYGELYQRVVRAMNMLRDLGVKRGDRVATFAWNHYRHMEIYYAVPALGAVLHTLNLRLSADQLKYIVNHAEDSLLFVDESLVKPVAALAPHFPTVRQYVVMSDSSNLPDTTLQPLADYEALMAKASTKEEFPELRENEACGLCYTSGTTGNPKGVLYSHRALYLQAMAACMTDCLGMTETDTVLPVVPMFHVNAWGTPFSCAFIGAKLVFAGANLQPDNLVNLMNGEHVTLALGVPTIWNNVLQYLRKTGGRLDSLRAMLMGGSAVPRALISAYKKELGVHVIQGWGMTEMSPLGSTVHLTGRMLDWPEEKQIDAMALAGMVAPNVEMRVLDDAGKELPWDGKSVGELLVRGPSVARGYYKSQEGQAAFTADGWFHTGDVASIDENGFVRISDRTKDLIKSGGEWISSVDMENAIMACPGVMEATVVARPDPKWDERPVAFIVRAEGQTHPAAQEVLTALAPKFADWQLPSPEDIRFVDQIPKTSVGKFDKKALRAQITAG